MEYVTAEQLARRWDVCLRTVHLYCSKGKIPGAEKVQNAWRIPSNASRPVDGRVRYQWDEQKMDYVRIKKEE